MLAQVAKYHLLEKKPHINLREGTITRYVKRHGLFNILHGEYPIEEPSNIIFYMKPIFAKGINIDRTDEVLSIKTETV